jgi:hypothetical protein
LATDAGGGRRGKVENAVRGREPESPEEWIYQREAVEHYLVADGYSLDELRGYEFEVETTQDRTDIAASLGRVTPRSARAVAAGSVALGTLLSVETGLLSPVVVSVVLGVVLYAVGGLPDPEPVVNTHKVRRPGLTETEVYRRLTMSNIIQELKEEEQKKARRKAHRKNRNPGGGRF